MDRLSVQDPMSLQVCQPNEQERTTKAQWTSLPPEIRLEIWERLAGDYDYNPVNSRFAAEKDEFATYAAVCREWQAFFESRLYRSLVLTQSCLETFKDYVDCRRMKCLENISLCIELGRLRCPECNELIQATGDFAISNMIVKAIQTLFTILSKWHKDQVSIRGLALEIGIYDLGSRDLQPAYLNGLRRGRGRFITCKHHGSIDAHRVRTETPILFYTPLVMSIPFDQGYLPTIDFVKGFIIRWQPCYSLEPRFLKRILGSLPNLEFIHYEQRRVINQDTNETALISPQDGKPKLYHRDP